MFVRVEEIIEQDEWQSTHGTMWGWKVRALDLGSDEQVFIALNSKPGNVLKPGTEFDFTPNGKSVGVYQSGKREQANGQRPNPYGGASTKAAAKPASGAANAPQGHSHAAPTMSQAVAVLKECVAAVEGWGSDAHATTLFLGRLRGDIVRDPSAAQLAAEATERQRKLDEEQKRLDDERARLEAKAPGYAPSALPEDDESRIPF